MLEPDPSAWSEEDPPDPRPSAAGTFPRRPDPSELDAVADVLERTGRYRILRRLRRREVSPPRPSRPGELLVVIVDVETTGLDHACDEVIELGMIRLICGGDGSVVEVTGTFSALREPSVPIPMHVTRLTGISPDDVRGKDIDVLEVEAFLRGADLVVAHHAPFDRPFCEGLAPSFGGLAWACSVREVDWAGLGYEGTKLFYLLNGRGLFHDGHRAVDDCAALLEVLAAPLPDGSGCALGRLVSSASLPLVRIWAAGAPFARKGLLKARGYRWDASERCWWIDVEEHGAEAELGYLRHEVCGPAASQPTRRLTAMERYKR